MPPRVPASSNSASPNFASFDPAGPPPRREGSAIRFWTIRHARFFSSVYRTFECLLIRLRPVFARFAVLHAVETPVTFVERQVKGALFDCRMCGKCVLSSTGLSCPMNCPKALRNGPCGGVRADGGCEVYPQMPCVWLKAWEGAQFVPDGVTAIGQVQPPVDHRQKGRSSWMAVLRGEHQAGKTS